MRVVVGGAGSIGMAIVRHLREEFNRVHITVIERNREFIERLLSKFPDVNVVSGDVADPDALRDSGVEDADAFIAVTGSDTINIVSCLLAKRMGAKKVIVKLGHVEYEELARALGIDYIVVPAEGIATQVELLLRSPTLANIFQLFRHGIEIFEVKVDEKSKYVGRTIEEVSTSNSLPILVVRGDDYLLPSRDLRLERGDRLVMMKKSGKKRFRIF